MKFLFKSTLIFIFAAVGIFACVSNYTSETVSANAAAAGSPAQIYAKNCARCHGADGKGDTELGRLNEVPDLTSGHVKGKSVKSMTNIIKNGEGSMPAFGKKLTAKDIAALVKYVRAL